MKQYVLDELRLEDYTKIMTYLDENYSNSGIDGLYWIELENNTLSDIQKQHSGCAPFCFAISLEENKLSCELLIRSMNQIHCNCTDYANIKQINLIIKLIDSITDKLKIIT